MKKPRGTYQLIREQTEALLAIQREILLFSNLWMTHCVRACFAWWMPKKPKDEKVK